MNALRDDMDPRRRLAAELLEAHAATNAATAAATAATSPSIDADATASPSTTTDADTDVDTDADTDADTSTAVAEKQADATPQLEARADANDSTAQASTHTTTNADDSAATPAATPAAQSTTTNNAAANPPAPATAAVRGEGCASDVNAFCKREANILALLENAPSGLDASSVAHAMQSVQLCMAKHIEALSSACIDELVAEMLRQQRDAESPTAAAAVKQQPEPADATAVSPPAAPTADEDSSMEVSIHYSRHHNSAGLLRSGGGGTGHAALTAAPATLAAPGESSGAGSPLLWLLVFPFFCVGLYTAYNHALVYLRRRRDIFRVESKQYTRLP